MKTISEISKLVNDNIAPSSRLYEVEAGTINRIYKAYTNLLNDKLTLEAKIALLELRLESRNETRERIVYG